MKNKTFVLICAFFYSVCLLAGCAQQEDVLSKMKKIVPVFEGARILASKMPSEKMSIIMMEVEASKASQKEILNFYKNAMTKQGWKLKNLTKHHKGSVMELVKKDLGTLTVLTMIEKTKKTGKIPVTLNLTIK
jgi:outer membrane murein-binding lipoprotein Lpp